LKPSTSTVASIGIGVPVATIISWALTEFAKIAVPGPVEAAIGVVIGAIVGYFFLGGKAADTAEESTS
jgi:hypothetical protein